ncbi:uncharacterized protein [Montipora foliosa]|uniref:uncharacterized protein isoform X1 n=1 Tax=Montipora foliosa TaxID=591990 RepID=UPI0035F116DF
MKTVIISLLIAIISVLNLTDVHAKPSLNEENRNLCEDEPDIAECIREVEDAKGNHDSAEQNQDESTTPDPEHGGDTLEEFLAKVDRLHWTEELRSMYKQKYGLF